MLIKVDTQRNKYKFYTIITVNTKLKDKEEIISNITPLSPKSQICRGNPPTPTQPPLKLR